MMMVVMVMTVFIDADDASNGGGSANSWRQER